ncbi:uncharacterized protein GGS22DRAFT_191033 [Annulohypoxylon maeteangense]|uniref:uncharacterized protein n=1 Tax=Annulohypoxylon maeteangense TaxID=1927788 RepID=UPI002008157B|nr:uncharacterized protein GGS22DRAFT_191033 [Annulohypoxylon maeteangense]KAI0882446.1 hypothetical protein GGS22DRAFT_191033 [Annulohypoxylon maeteangense]
MMLTSKQPVHHGYRPVHDLPTPPRSSPPLSIQDPLQKPYLAFPQKQSPSTKPMSAPHRGLPLPAAMTLAQPPPPPAPGPPHPPAPGPPLHSQGQPIPSPHSQSLGALPPPPHQSSEESMRTWLVAKAEEERRRQEEEKTRQEGLRLEQRRLEYDMLRTSLDRGIPPPMVPVVFAGMGGGVLPQAALEWAQQYLMPQQAHAGQIMPSQGGLSPETRRESQQYGGQPYGVPSTPGSGTGAQASFVPYPGPGSPRPRAHTMGMGGAVGRPLGGSALPRLSTGEGPGGPSGIPHPAHALAQQQGAPQQQETQSPSIYFHHWQPPTTHGGSNQPGTPSVESPKKRKATGPQQPAPPPSQPRFRSPPFGQHGGSTLSNPPPGRRRGHSRQRSDISSYRSAGRGRIESFGPHRGLSPGLGPSREAGMGESSQQQQQPRSGAHSVSSLLSDQPSPRYPSEMRAQQGESERRNSPSTSDDRSRGGGGAAGVGSATGHPGPGRETD